jgi:hypothetical protein
VDAIDSLTRTHADSRFCGRDRNMITRLARSPLAFGLTELFVYNEQNVFLVLEYLVLPLFLIVRSPQNGNMETRTSVETVVFGSYPL